MRVAVVGAGVAGLTAARTLARAGVEVVLYEKEKYVGGHAYPLRCSHDGSELDVGFVPFNQASYSDLVPLFDEVGVEVESCDMSVGVSITENKKFEWSSAGFRGLFAQKRNMLNPYFWNMIREILKFNTDVQRYLQKVESNDSSINLDETLGKFLESYGYSKKFKEDYLFPICVSIWSCPSDLLFGLSAASVLTFLSDHKLLQLLPGRSQYLSMRGGPQTYVEKVMEDLKTAGTKIKTSALVTQITILERGRVQLEDDKGGLDVFDECIVAANAPDALQMRGEDATLSEKNFLGAVKYLNCDIYMHRDTAFMPKNKAVWSALNVQDDACGGSFATYWLNPVQNMGHTGLPFLMTLNPATAPQHVEKHWRTRQPLPTVEAMNHAKQFGSFQGRHGVWYCGSYRGFGSGLPGASLKYGLETATQLLGQKLHGLGSAKRIVPSWLEFAAKRTVIAVLKNFVCTGSLRLIEAGGSILEFTGDGKGCNLKFVLQINNPAFYWKIATKADLGLAHAYIDGDFSFPGGKKRNLCKFFEFIIANVELAKARTESQKSFFQGWWNPLFVTATLGTAVSYCLHLLRDNSITNSRRNISDHYDMSNEMFSLFMDETMTYSCGIFKGPNDTLKDAQLRKLHLLIDKARVKPNHEVLEIGFGWGSMAIELVRRTGCRYTGISLSVEQLKYAQNLVKDAGLEDRITFQVCDYRVLPGHHKFDRIIACEMIEHLGHNYQKVFFDRCDYLLAKHGLVVLQSSSCPDDIYDSYRRSGGFIREIFPGGNLPCLSVLASSAASKFSVEQVDNIGPHYYQTLMCWQENLLANSSEIKRLGFDDQFIRRMVYFFSFCAAGFRSCVIGCIQVVLSRPGNTMTLGDPAVCFPAVLGNNEEAWKQ
ncbi:unnamed protein product [Calypogeia fissa]